VTSGAASPRRGQRVLERLDFDRVDFDRLALPALAVAVVVSGFLLFHLSRGSSFWVDDWNWITSRRGNTVDTFLAPYNGHLSLVPIAIYRLMFAVFGLSSYTPYRAVVILLSLVVALFVFAYARARVGDLVAMLLAVSLLFLGPGWQDTMWAFQIPWLIVCAAGIGGLMLLERRTARADAAVCALLLLSICSTSLGLAFAIGMAVDLALTRRRWRDAWIVALPLVLYAIWALHYHPTSIDASAIPTIPLNAAEAAAVAMSVLTGLSGILPFDATGTSLIYGWPLLVFGLLFALWRARTVRPKSRSVTLAVTFVAFAGSVSIVHGALAGILSSRYIYIYCLLAALLIAELARGIRPSRPVQAALCVVTLAAVVANIGNFRAQGTYIRVSGDATNGALTGLDLDRATVDPGTHARIALYQFVTVTARAYFDAERALGSPAYTIAQLRTAPGAAQSATDSQLLADGDVTLVAAPASPGGASPTAGAGTQPSVLAAANGTLVRSGSCIRFVPVSALAPGITASVSLTVGAGRLSVSTAAAPATLSVRRFAATLTPLGTVTQGGSAIVTIRRDSAPQPWFLDVSSNAPVQACTVRP
jgi:hypothetical protein